MVRLPKKEDITQTHVVNVLRTYRGRWIDEDLIHKHLMNSVKAYGRIPGPDRRVQEILDGLYREGLVERKKYLTASNPRDDDIHSKAFLWRYNEYELYCCFSLKAGAP